MTNGPPFTTYFSWSAVTNACYCCNKEICNLFSAEGRQTTTFQVLTLATNSPTASQSGLHVAPHHDSFEHAHQSAVDLALAAA
jgi:hypothetical protein